MTLKGFGIALCVWIVWLFIILTVMGAGAGKVEQLGALIMAAAPDGPVRLAVQPSLSAETTLTDARTRKEMDLVRILHQ